MKLELHRKELLQHSTVGYLLTDGEYECFTVEDPVRDLGPHGEGKIFQETAIPAGTYEVVINMSPWFKKMMPRLLNVPFFDGILIHAGNTAKDTWGCILVGMFVKNGVILPGTSKAAYNALFSKLTAAVARGEQISITITDDFKGATP